MVLRRMSVFGSGFVGRSLAPFARAAGWSCEGYTRHPALAGEWRFDARSATVPRHPGVAVVTFPPALAPPRFWSDLLGAADHVVLLGTTSSYRPAGATVDATTSVDPTSERAPHEAAVLDRGGCVLRLSGLYGGGRQPWSWLAAGRVGCEARTANLVHRDDVCAVVEAAARAGVSGAWPVSDGQRVTWADIAAWGVAAGRLSVMAPTAPSRPDVFVDGSAIAARLGHAYRGRRGALIADAQSSSALASSSSSS